MKEIGGYFELELEDRSGFIHDAGIQLNTGRNALELILRHLPCSSKVYIPNYTCEVVLEPFDKLEIQYSFYSVDSQLEISDELILGEKEYLLYTNYFGVKDSYVRYLVNRYPGQVIVDNAQALFAPIIPNIKAVYSTRKYVGVADGGFAVGVTSYHVRDYEEDNSTEHDSHLYIRKEKGAEAGFKDYQINECKLDNQPIRRMASQTQKTLSQIDYDSVIEKRRQNYLYLSKVLGEMNLLQLPSIDSFACPMVYPFMASDESLRTRLIENKIFVARYWPNVLEWCGDNELEYKIKEKLYQKGLYYEE